VHEEAGLVLVSKHLQKHSHKGSNFDPLVIAAKVTADRILSTMAEFLDIVIVVERDRKTG
jgi:hypothetical protein